MTQSQTGLPYLSSEIELTRKESHGPFYTMGDNDTLVVSFCNVKRWGLTASGGICAARIGSAGVERCLHSQVLPIDIGGATGLCKSGNDIVCLLQHPRHAVMCRLNRDLEPVELTELTSVTRPHSICHHNHKFYVVSTGNDTVVEVEPSGTSSAFWKRSDMLEHPIHLNSICVTPDGHFYGSAFGSFSSPENQNRRHDGYIMDLTKNVKIIAGLSHPHTVTCFQNGLLFCQSVDGCICDTYGTTIRLAESYPRGMALTSERIYVGISARRTASISQSSTILQANQFSKTGPEIVVYSWDGQHLRTAQEHHRIYLGDMAREIYDIMVM